MLLVDNYGSEIVVHPGVSSKFLSTVIIDESYVLTIKEQPNDPKQLCVIESQSRIIDTINFEVVIECISLPSPPEMIIDASGKDHIRIEWNDTHNTGNYNVYRRDSDKSNSDFILLQSGVETQIYVDVTAELGKIYAYAISSVNQVGESDWIVLDNIAFLIRSMSTPSNFEAQYANGILVLSWDEVENANSYTIYRHAGLDLNSPAEMIFVDLTDTKFIDSSFVHSMFYSYFIEANNDYGSIRSAELIVNNPIDLADVYAKLNMISTNPLEIAVQNGSTNSKSTIVFNVVENGYPLKNQLVTFSLSSTPTDITLSSESETSDNNGRVSVDVISGVQYVSDMYVTATIKMTDYNGNPYTATANSSSIAVGSSLVDQHSISLRVESLNPEAWDYDGVTVDVTAFAADSYGNKIPDGTQIDFLTEGGKIEPSCKTQNGSCQVKWTSQNPRPADHRVSILAAALGNESILSGEVDDINLPFGEPFIDINKNKIFDEPFVDSNNNGVFDEPFLNASNGQYDASNPYIDYNNNGIYDGAGNYPLGEVVFKDRNNNGEYDGTGKIAEGE